MQSPRYNFMVMPRNKQRGRIIGISITNDESYVCILDMIGTRMMSLCLNLKLANRILYFMDILKSIEWPTKYVLTVIHYVYLYHYVMGN